MSSSSSSGFSDNEMEASAPSAVVQVASQLSKVVEVAQICSFCTTFRKPLHLPSFSRTELQEALRGASNGDTPHMELLAELHFKLAREHPTAKMEKMVQDWEKTLARKLQDNWRKEFTVNPMGGGVMYRDLTVFERVNILDALCHWKLDTCTEIQNYVATLQKESNNEAIKSLRAEEIGTDDKGVSYWYFGDGCWVYAEDKPRWQLEERKSSYLVEFASAKTIRLSVNFDPDHNSSAPPHRLSLKVASSSDEIKQEKKEKKEKKEEVALHEVKDDKQKVLNAKMEDDAHFSEAVKLKNEQMTMVLMKTEKEEISTSSIVEAGLFTVAGKDIAAETAAYRRLNTSVLSGLSEHGNGKHGGEPSAGLLMSNGSLHKQYDEGLSTGRGAANADLAQITVAKNSASPTNSPQSSAKVRGHSEISPEKMDTGVRAENDFSGSPEKGLSVKVDDGNLGGHTKPCVVAVVGAKKRTIIDDDSSDSSSSDADTSKSAVDKNADLQAAPSSPPWKKRKASTEISNSVAVLGAGTAKGNSTTLSSTKVNGKATFKAIISDSGTSRIKEAISSVLKADPGAFDLKETQLDVFKPSASHMEESSSSSRTNRINEVVLKSESTEARVTGNIVDLADPMSPIDPAAAPETFDITCESCKKCYDMRYLDPPLVERPTDEWRCFECLVNDARGWPRRRKPYARQPISPRANNRVKESSSRKRSSSSKPQSESSSSKKSKISIKSRSNSTSKRRSNHSSSSKRKLSGSQRSGSTKSSSSSKRHKKRKSSSSSRHRHGSSHSHHRRRHSHHHHEEFAKLVKSFRERQEQRLGIEDARTNGKLQVACDEGPQGWRVASSTLDELRALIQSLLGGSLEQDRLRGRLILIVKDQEKLEEQWRKQQELAWDILPRRQSSRIAIGRMKNQSAQDLDVEEGYFGDDVEGKRSGLRFKRRQSTSDSVDGKQKHDRAWRARRRRNNSDDDMHLDNEEDEVDSRGTGNWIDWSAFKDNGCCLSTVCLAVVNRLLKEEASDLFSRPVDPDVDGCPNYLSVIDQPMDLGTIRSRVEANFYRKWDLFKKDVELVWQNCRKFNAPDTMVVQFANLLKRLSRSMCIAAEKKGVDRLRSKGSGDDGRDESGNNLSDVSKAESCGSINKAWTESSASESRESSDDGGNSDARCHKRRSTRTPTKNMRTRTRSTRSSGTSSRARGSTRSRSSRNFQSPTSSSKESSASDDEVCVSLRKRRWQLRGSSSQTGRKVGPSSEDEDSSDDESADNQPQPPQNRSPSPPPPPPPQAVQKCPKPRLVISESSNSDDSSDSDDSSSSSSSDSVDSDSDTRSANKYPEPPPPSSADAPAPPPPSPPLPATLSEDDKSVQSSPAKQKSAAGQAKKSNVKPHSPPLLKSCLSPSPSSSPDFSSSTSDSSDDDSDST